MEYSLNRFPFLDMPWFLILWAYTALFFPDIEEVPLGLKGSEGRTIFVGHNSQSDSYIDSPKRHRDMNEWFWLAAVLGFPSGTLDQEAQFTVRYRCVILCVGFPEETDSRGIVYFYLLFAVARCHCRWNLGGPLSCWLQEIMMILCNFQRRGCAFTAFHRWFLDVACRKDWLYGIHMGCLLCVTWLNLSLTASSNKWFFVQGTR